MEFKSFDDYVKHRLSQKEIDEIKKEAKDEFDEFTSLKPTVNRPLSNSGIGTIRVLTDYNCWYVLSKKENVKDIWEKSE